MEQEVDEDDMIEPFDFEVQAHDRMHDWVRALVVQTLPVDIECMDRVIDPSGYSGTLYFHNGITVGYEIDREAKMLHTQLTVTQEAIKRSVDQVMSELQRLHPKASEEEISGMLDSLLQGDDSDLWQF
jgi:hypothetical protein